MKVFKVIVTCTCVDTGETSHFTREVEDLDLLWEKEQMSLFKGASTAGRLDETLEVWSTTVTGILNGGYRYIKTWSQYLIPK